MSALTVRSTERPLAEINITPLIDVMLALLLIFMISAPLLTGKIALPLSGKPQGPVARTVDVRIAADGQVLYNGTALSRMELEAQFLSWAAQGENAPGLQLQPDKAATHQQFVDVLSLAHQAGLDGISIGTPNQ